MHLTCNREVIAVIQFTKEMDEKIHPPGPSMTYRQVRQKKQKYIISTSQELTGIKSFKATIIRQTPSSYIL
jgi:hypothetical protein